MGMEADELHQNGYTDYSIRYARVLRCKLCFSSVVAIASEALLLGKLEGPEHRSFPKD